MIHPMPDDNSGKVAIDGVRFYRRILVYLPARAPFDSSILLSSCSYCCGCCSAINLHIEVRGHRTGLSHSGAEKYPREKHKRTERCTYIYIYYISQLTLLIPPPETYEKSNRESACDAEDPILVPTSNYSRL